MIGDVFQQQLNIFIQPAHRFPRELVGWGIATFFYSLPPGCLADGDGLLELFPAQKLFWFVYHFKPPTTLCVVASHGIHMNPISHTLAPKWFIYTPFV